MSGKPWNAKLWMGKIVDCFSLLQQKIVWNIISYGVINQYKHILEYLLGLQKQFN